MNATERARRSDSMYYGEIRRRELCDRVAQLESDLMDAKADLKDARAKEKFWHMQAEKFGLDLLSRFGSHTK